MNANEQKAREGQTSSQPDTTSRGTVLDVSKWTTVKDQPSLVKARKGKDGNVVQVDFWNQVFPGLDVDALTTILDQSKVDSAYDMTQFIRGIEYQGFDRLFYIKHALTKMSVSVFSRFAIVGCLRGSNFMKIKDTCDYMPADLVNGYSSLNFVKTPKKRTDLTILRNTASIPHWCVYWCMKADVSKKIETEPCPASLQFPGAASLPMSKELRLNHLRFCQAFSMLLPGGKFNTNIYMTAYKNQIPVEEIPVEVCEILGVNSKTPAYQIADADMAPYTQAILKV